MFALIRAHANIRNMKLIMTVIFLAQTSTLLAPGLQAQEESLMQDAITRPALSLRCKELLQERADKIKNQQRLNGLLQRNQNLLKRSPNAPRSVVSRLKANQIRIKNELHLTNLNIETMEENIVRSGCPGISL